MNNQNCCQPNQNPNPEEKKNKKSFFDIIKNIFILLIFLQFAPMIIINIKDFILDNLTSKSQVGCINIKGFLGNSSFYVKKIQEFSKDENIKALFIKIDSPGGLPGTSQAIFNELKKFKEKKPIVTYVENVCASAAYYIASQSSAIISTPSALVGSIGVLLQLPNVKELLESFKVKFNYIQSGKFKTAGSPLKNNSPEEIEYLQKLADENYKQFLKDVAQSRKLSEKEFEKWADGKVFLGVEAVKNGLIDAIGSQSDAIDKLKKLADIQGEIKFVVAKQATGIMSILSSKDEEDLSEIDFSSKVANFLSSVLKKMTLENETAINQI